MDFVRNLFGGLTSTIFRLIVVFGTMAAIYFFAIRPALDTTEEISRSISDPINQSLQLSQEQIEQAQQQIEDAVGDIPSNQVPNQVQITRIARGLSPEQAQKLADCLQRAGGDITFINACFDRFDPKNRQR